MLRSVGLATEPADTVAGSLGPDWWRPALSAGELAGQTPPAWAAIAERAAAAAVPPQDVPIGSWPEAFAVPFLSFVALARDQLSAGISQHVARQHAEAERVANAFTTSLKGRTARLAVRTLMRELRIARASRRLDGADGYQRFADFIRQQSAPAALAALFREYPVLARLLGTACQLTVEAGLELMNRFARDRAAIVAQLLAGQDPGPVIAVEPCLGDLHRQGRSVASVTFADGRSVIYKPRDLAAHLLLRDVTDWLSQRMPGCELRTPRALAMPGYGWVEFIDHQPLPSPDAAAAFYRRTGALLAALHVLRVTDVHCENIIACGDHPVIVDAEAVFHPTLTAAVAVTPDPAATALTASVHRVALLPGLEVSGHGLLDRSGMGGDRGQVRTGLALDWDPPATDSTQLVRRDSAFPGAANRPLAGAAEIEPADYEDAVLDGFRLAYSAITGDRDSFAALIASGGDVEARVIVRPTGDYARLLDESTEPDLLRDARQRDVSLDPQRWKPADLPLWRELAPHELADLRAGDIPLLTTRPATRDIWTSAGHRLPCLLSQTGLSGALDILAAMGEVDRRDQEWVISACLATRRPVAGHVSSRPMPGPLTAIAAQPVRMLAAACGMADQIVARGMADPDGDDGGSSRVNWIGLQFVDDLRWMVLPMGASLTDGYLGVGLFLAQLSELTGLARYAEVARRAVRPVARLLDALDGSPGMLAAVGCGAAGLGGISYGLSRMAVLLDDTELRECAELAVRVTAHAAGLTSSPWWMTGHSGCLAAMCAVQAELGSAAAEDLARTSARQLIALADSGADTCVPVDEPVPRGFASGPAGVGWALVRFARSAPAGNWFQAGQRVIRNSAGPMDPAVMISGPGWCSGAAGLLMARTCLEDAGEAELMAAGRELASRPILDDLSLCHGELGVADALAVLDTVTGQDRVIPGFRRQAGFILDAATRRTRYCGTPGAVETSGLFSGLAGIGYGLLRLGFPATVPSVLLMEPAVPV